MNLRDGFDYAFNSRDSWRDGKGAATARINANHVMRILGPDTDLSSITTGDIARMSQQLMDEGKAKATVNRITAALSTLYTELQNTGFDVTCPHYKRQKENVNSRPDFYEDWEIDKLLATSQHMSDYLLLHDSILFAYKTGCRQGEMLGLRARDIDFENDELVFRDTKNGDDHYLPIHKDLIPVLERRMHYAINQEVFPWRDKDQLLRAFKTLQRACGISTDKCWHTIRHTTATHLVTKGVAIRQIMGVLNHKNINTSLRYAKVATTAKKAALDLL